MGKLTLKMNISFNCKFVADTEEVMEVLTAACECYKDPETPEHVRNVAAATIKAALDKGLDGVAEFAIRKNIRNYIKEDLTELEGKSPVVVTFR